MTSLVVTIDIDQVSFELDQLAGYSSSSPPSVTRILWSDVDLQARAFLWELCEQAGLAVREDAVGNMFARWQGRDPSLAPVASGSHIDAIPNAGRYDGTLGVLGALEAIRALQRTGFQPQRSLDLVMFTAEEPTRFGIGCLGSRVLSGMLQPTDLVALHDDTGQSFAALRAAAGLDHLNLHHAQLAKGAYAAFVELHIEQGPRLEAAHIPIGIVRSIAAPGALRLRLTGEGGHAGAVLMPDRHDALLAGAEIALAVEQSALTSGSPDTVGTTGVLRIEPGAINSIPSRALLEIDVRDTALEPRDRTIAAIKQAAAEVCARRGVTCELEMLNADPPATCDPGLVETVAQVCQSLSMLYEIMISRAYHDALFMARICPVTMIFIPCRAGISHRPDEYADPDDIAAGITTLAHTLARLSAQ